jgi:3-hydroxybutyryl-CoA dehydrogenase
MHPIRSITVVGLGTLGTQIAIQASAYGYDVSGYARNPDTFHAMHGKIREAMRMTGKGPTFPVEQWAEYASRVKLYNDLALSTRAADLVIESVPEDLEIKRSLFAQLDEIAPPHAILASNSSSIPISRIESATRRPERCLNLHFYQPAVGMNMADVMGGTRTAPDVLASVAEFVKSIDCVPLRVLKEIHGFCFNSVWRAVKRQTLYMWANGFVDLRDIDRAWMAFTGMSYGPFFMMDLVGLDVVLAIEHSYHRESGDPRDAPPAALTEKVKRGELGVKSGRGFYTYPHPEFAQQGFLHGG